jgi:hypothetical protein
MAVQSLAQFEGIVRSRNLTTDEMGAPQEFLMVMWVKDGRLKVEMSPAGAEPGSTVIYRNDLGCYWVVNAAEHTYIEVRRMPGNTSDSLDRGRVNARSRLKRTGKTKKILGYAAVQMSARDGDLQTELWGSSDLAPLARAMATSLGDDGAGTGGSEMTRELASLGMYPLLARIRMDGNVVEESEVTAIERVSLPDSLFILPAGFRKQVMDEMFEMPPR